MTNIVKNGLFTGVIKWNMSKIISIPKMPIKLKYLPYKDETVIVCSRMLRRQKYPNRNLVHCRDNELLYVMLKDNMQK